MPKEIQKTYLVQRRIRCAMIGTFVCSLMIILVASIIFFYMFLDDTLNLSVVSIFDAHTYSIVKDIIQVKRNDLMLVQNELKASSTLMIDLIERRNFNPYSLYQDFDQNDPTKYDELVTMQRLRKYLTNTMVEYSDYKRTGVLPPNEKIYWQYDPHFTRLDETKLEK